MQGQNRKIDSLVTSRKHRKIQTIQWREVRRHSRVLYVPIDATTARIYGIKKGDIIKIHLIELRPAPDEDAPIPAFEGEL